MDKSNEDIINLLNRLIETCRDGQQGYHTAANAVKNSDLKTLFKNYSRQRAQFIDELQGEVRRLGGKPEKTGSVTGALHRGWMDVKSAVTDDEEAAVIAECERGEDSAVKTYKEAIAADLPPELRILIQHQFIQVQESHDLVRALEKATR